MEPKTSLSIKREETTTSRKLLSLNHDMLLFSGVFIMLNNILTYVLPIDEIYSLDSIFTINLNAVVNFFFAYQAILKTNVFLVKIFVYDSLYKTGSEFILAVLVSRDEKRLYIIIVLKAVFEIVLVFYFYKKISGLENLFVNFYYQRFSISKEEKNYFLRIKKHEAIVGYNTTIFFLSSLLFITGYLKTYGFFVIQKLIEMFKIGMISRTFYNKSLVNVSIFLFINAIDLIITANELVLGINTNKMDNLKIMLYFLKDFINDVLFSLYIINL